jgi:iron complex outermembrane receptor protein
VQRNAIDYEVEGGLIKNIFSNRRVGAELELLAQTRLGRFALDGFASTSYVRLVDETVLDPELEESDRLVWAPSHLAKAGARVSSGRFGGTATLYYQGKTRRRTSDRIEEMWNELRPRDVPAWLSVGATLFYRPWTGVKTGVEATNLFDTAGPIINSGAHAFDYRTPPREIMAVVELDL